MKSFLIYDEKGDFAAWVPRDAAANRTISPLSLSTGGAKNACRHNNNNNNNSNDEEGKCAEKKKSNVPPQTS